MGHQVGIWIQSIYSLLKAILLFSGYKLPSYFIIHCIFIKILLIGILKTKWTFVFGLINDILIEVPYSAFLVSLT